MNLSMWIIANCLASFDPEVHIVSDSPRILRSARLAYATDCVYVHEDEGICTFSWNDDYIRLPDISFREGFELLQSIFDSMLDWHQKLSNAIASKQFQKAVDLCYVIFHNPINLSDANHHCIALSSQYGPNDVDDEWYHLSNYGYSSLKSSQQLSNATISRHFHDRLIRYQFPVQKNLHGCTCSAIMNEGMTVGFLTVLEKEHTFNLGHMQALSMISDMLAPALVNIGQNSCGFQAVIEPLLSGKPIPEANAIPLLQEKKWQTDHQYRVMQFLPLHNANAMWMREHYFLVGSLSTMFPEDICGLYNNSSLVIIANETLLDGQKRMERLKRQLADSHLKLAVSLPSQGLSSIVHLYDQTKFVANFGVQYYPDHNILDFYNFAVDYLIRMPYSPERTLAACHPDVLSLYRSDDVLYRTLWVYLMMDRSATRTTELLYVHKNTLLHRLRKIEDNLHWGLGDPYTREYMRLSFMLLERHAGLPFPPEFPFLPDESDRT